VCLLPPAPRPASRGPHVDHVDHEHLRDLSGCVVPLMARCSPDTGVGLSKRSKLKKLLKASAPDLVLRFKLQRDSLKWLLVCCFGYTGYKNARVGKIEAHEAINAVARETLLVAKEIAEADGFELIHALVDSLYVWKDGATREDYERLSQKIEDRRCLPLAIESVYRCVVVLPSKQYADVPVPNRFFAVGEDRELSVQQKCVWCLTRWHFLGARALYPSVDSRV
jgi:hypothetical protein